MNIVKISIYGCAIWAAAFAVGFAAYPLHSSNFMLFKTIMIVTCALIGMTAIIRFFSQLDSDFVKNGIAAGSIWLIINIALDLIVLVALFKTPAAKYAIEIGLRYLIIPIMTVGTGILLQKKSAV